MDNKILFICTGHQSTDKKVEHVKTLLSQLKAQGADICFTTHIPNGLEEITPLCDYLVYDKDDYFPDENQLLKALPDIPNDRLNASYYAFYNFGKFELRWNWVRSHSKPAVANFKNGLTIAKERGYEWIVYLEYDTVLPGGNIVEYFYGRMEEFKNNGTDGHFYLWPNNGAPTVWPIFFLCKTDIFTSDDTFYTDWQKSNVEYFKKIGILPIEELLMRIASKRKVIFEPMEAINTNMGYNITKTSEVSIFNALDEPENKTYFGKLNPFDFFIIDLMPVINSGKIEALELWVVSKDPIPKPPKLIVEVYKDGNRIINFDDFNTSIPFGAWTCFPIISDIEQAKKDDIIIDLSITFETDEGNFTKSITLHMKDIEKYSMYKHKIITDGN